MQPLKRMLERLNEAQQRFDEREPAREAIRGQLERGQIVEANDDHDLRARAEHVGAPPAVVEALSTAAADFPMITEAASTRETIDNITFERLIGANDLMPISYLQLGSLRSRSVGRIHVKNRGGQRLGFGTGFLVSPRLLLTNNHVLETAADAEFSEVEFNFELDLGGNLGQSVFFRLQPASFFVTNRPLDYTLVAVEPQDAAGHPLSGWGWNKLLETDGLIVKGEYVSIIQHPRGEAKQVAMRENQVIDLLDNFAHYHTDTAPGSSGSPVFNDQWEIVALHHSGVPQRDAQNRILAVDGRVWEEWMGDHRIKWIANEGVSVQRIVSHLKSINTLNDDQKRFRDELLNSEPTLPVTEQSARDPRASTTPIRVVSNKTPLLTSGGGNSPTGNGATWTIPLQVTVNLGAAQMGTSVAAVRTQGPSPGTGVVSVDDVNAAAVDDLQKALAKLEDSSTQTYFDEHQDAQDRAQYYAGIDADQLSRTDLYDKLSSVLKTTHGPTLSYKPSLHLYPWVDLHPDRKLRSIYSGATFDAEEMIREDFRVEQERARLLQEFMLRENSVTPERMQEELDLLEDQNPFNCEHVVPQSWFNKKQPMKGDLHHLFTCEMGCNSFRGNLAYFDFAELEEAERTDCGRREGQNKFEPVAGKGAVARATLYFLLRYPGKIDDPGEMAADRISTLLQWHADHPVTEYERHRNQAIFAVQRNRNPLIDFPEWAGKIDFKRGLS